MQNKTAVVLCLSISNSYIFLQWKTQISKLFLVTLAQGNAARISNYAEFTIINQIFYHDLVDRIREGT